VAEDERKQLARQLHDGPTQKVSAMVMMIRIIRKMLERSPEKLPDELTKMEEIAVTTSQEMRYMLFTLRPLVLESQGLTAALEDLATKTQQTHGQRVEIYVEPGIERHLDGHKQATVFYLVEEAINNARKYAQAAVIHAEVRRQGRDLVITIHDDGVGFDVEAVLNNHAKSGSLGMVNMRERAAMLNGTLNLASAPGSGTRITIVAPLVIELPRIAQQDSAIANIALDTLKVGHHDRPYASETQRVQRNGNLSRR
jgi:signal transduction histidine kinase